MAQRTIERSTRSSRRPAVTPAPAAPIRGTVFLDDRQQRWQRVAVLAVTLIPFAAFALAVISLWGRGMWAADAIAFGVLYMITGLGVTVGFHRLLTHQSFEAPRWVRYGFAIAGSLAVQGSVISWVADHRRHHAYSDKEGDPHSPHLDEGDGFAAILRGLAHAHMGWFFSPERTERERWAPDLFKDAGMRRIDRSFPLLLVGTFVLPGLIGLALTRSIDGMVGALIWGGPVRVFFLHHVTWSINSICHFFGRRTYETTDYSTNNWPLALISFGESWHNNHHAFPTSAVHGLGKWQVDTSAMTISVLEKLGLAREVKRPSIKQLRAKELLDQPG